MWVIGRMIVAAEDGDLALNPEPGLLPLVSPEPARHPNEKGAPEGGRDFETQHF